MPFARLLLLIAFLTAPAALAQRTTQQTAQALNDIMERFHEAGQLNGAVLVAQGDEVLYSKGFGEANMEWDIPNAPSTRFRIGSITKQFTAALILQLMEEGKVDLDAPITRYLPAYPATVGDRVTVHQLLSHTSGIPSYTSLPGFMQDDSRDPYAPDSFLSVFSGLPLEFEPGTAYAYNNSGYFLLGVIVEHVTGMPYDEALQTRLLGPLGLADTGYDHFGEIIERRAAGYEKVGMGYENAAYLDTSIPYAAGSMYSTVGDLYRWTRALHGGNVFRDAETLALMTTPVMENYGYGLHIDEVGTNDGTTPVIRHGGGINGFLTMLAYFPDDGYTIAVADNTSQDADEVAAVAARVLYDMPLPTPRRSVADPVAAAIEAGGVEAGIARYRALKADEADTYDFAESELNRLGYHYLGQGDIKTATRLFELNVEQFPEAFNTYDSLGEAYMEAGDTERAIANYQRSVELNPANANGIRMLERMGIETEEPEITVPEAVLEEYVGSYPLQPGFVINVTREGSQLSAQATGQPRFDIFPLSDTRFYLKVVDAQITFNRNAAGAVESLTLHQGGRDMNAPKE